MNFLQNKIKLISAIIFIIYFLPWIILGENSYILIHDNLDSNIVWFKTLLESGKLFSSNYDLMPMFMHAPRVSFGSEFNLILLLNYLFDPYTAYVVNQFFMRIVAFLGMYLLLNKYIFKQKYLEYSTLIALLYSLLPFWPSGGLSVAGLPLITYSFLNFKTNSSTYKDWIILVIFPFYSSFILSMMFFIALLSGYFFYYTFKKRELNKKFLFAIIIFTSLFIFTNYRLFDAFIFANDFISHRTQRSIAYKTLSQSFISSYHHFVFGQYHAASLHILLLPFIIVIFLMNLFSKNKDKLFLQLFALNVLISLWYGFWKFEGWAELKESIPILNLVNLARVHFLSPLIWYVLFALAVKYLLENIKLNKKSTIIYIMIFIQVIFLYSKSDFVQVYKKNNISYKQFYATKIFDDINQFIGTPKKEYMVASIGIHPSIARYNGFYTADGYLANYSLSYKKKFRNIISDELNKNEKLKNNFDNWGNRCYIFISEIGYNLLVKKDKTKNIDININSEALQKLNVRYLFSSYKIQNASDNNLQFLKIFTSKDSAWDIYLYKTLEEHETKRTIQHN